MSKCVKKISKKYLKKDKIEIGYNLILFSTS